MTLSEVHFVWRAVQNLYFSQCLYNTMNRQKGTFHIYNYIFTLLSKYNKKTKSISFSIVYHCTSLWVCILMSENSTRSWSDCIVVQLIGQVAILIYVMVFQWLVAGRWFSSGSPLSCTNKTDRHDITETLRKVALNTTTITSMSHVTFFTNQIMRSKWIEDMM